MKNKDLLKHIFSLLLFGLNGIVASEISLSSYEIVLFRTMLGSGILVMLFWLKGNRFTFYKNKVSAGFLIGSGVSMGISWILLYEAYQQIGVSIATLGYYSGPVFVMILSPFLFSEKLTKEKITGFLIVLFGIVFVNSDAFNESHTVFGIVCSLLSAVTYALMVILNKKAKDIDGMQNTTVQLFSAFLTVGVFLICKQGVYIPVQKSDIVPLLILGIINTGIGCYLYFSSIGVLKVQTVAVLGYLEPLSAVVFSVLILGENLNVWQVFGAGMIVLGAIYASRCKE